MIQSILFFALGFLCAGFLALMVAPAVWRRAVRLTQELALMEERVRRLEKLLRVHQSRPTATDARQSA